MFGLALLLTLVVPDEEEYSWAVIALSLVGKLAITASYGVVYVFSAELFPTEVRQKKFKTPSSLFDVIFFLGTKCGNRRLLHVRTGGRDNLPVHQPAV